MKKIFSFLVLVFIGTLCFAQVSFEPESVLSEKLVKNFTENYEKFFADLAEQNVGSTISTNISSNVRESFSKVSKLKPSKKVATIFENYGFDKAKGYYQILVLQYGIIAYTIEEALTEIQGTTRADWQKENDRQTIALLSEIKAQLNSNDYALIKKYGKELYDIFNNK